MHVAIAVGAMLFGGVVLSSGDDEETGYEQSTESSYQQAEPQSRQQRRPAMGMGTPQGGNLRGRTGAGAGGQQQPVQRQPAMMPVAPTDSMGMAADGGFGQPMAPTSSSALMDGSRSGRSGSLSPRAPTERRSASSQMGSGYHPTSNSAIDQTKRVDLQRSNSSFMAPALTDKAFSGYRPSSGVSPYMNLFRRDALGTIDNYTSLVRPELEQRSVNQQYNREIRGLERNTRMQGSQLNRDARTLQGVGTPQFYQNYGQ